MRFSCDAIKSEASRHRIISPLRTLPFVCHRNLHSLADVDLNDLVSRVTIRIDAFELQVDTNAMGRAPLASPPNDHDGRRRCRLSRSYRSDL